MTNPSICDGCSIKKNQEEWAKYPDMLEMCKMCLSFQKAISKTIDDHKKLLQSTKKDIENL